MRVALDLGLRGCFDAPSAAQLTEPAPERKIGEALALARACGGGGGGGGGACGEGRAAHFQR